MRKRLMIIGTLLVIILAGCYNDKYDQLYVTSPNVTCDSTAVSYAAIVAPIIAANCNISGGCHDATGAVSKSGYDLTSYSGVLAVANYNFLISDINGNPTLRHHSMPLNLPKLSQCDINKITAWVNQGARNN